MIEAVLVSFITGFLALIGTIISSIGINKKNEQNIKINQAVTNEKLAELTREVREHNNFARRMPVVEEQIRIINQFLEDLK
ncbi:MAG: hypothetical protein IJO00_01965 [Clostridia bacterium]|nr:hypothetical protein [Clostridia bacterium]